MRTSTSVGLGLPAWRALALGLVFLSFFFPGCKSKPSSQQESTTQAPRGAIELVFPYGSEKEKWITDVKIPLFPTTTPREGWDLLQMLCNKRQIELAESTFARLEPLIPTLLTPGAAEALAVKIYRQVRTSSSSLDDTLRACLTDYQNPVPSEVMSFQIQLAAKEASDLDFVPAAMFISG